MHCTAHNALLLLWRAPHRPRLVFCDTMMMLLQRFAGKTIVVKYGGAAMKDPKLKVGGSCGDTGGQEEFLWGWSGR